MRVRIRRFDERCLIASFESKLPVSSECRDFFRTACEIAKNECTCTKHHARQWQGCSANLVAGNYRKRYIHALENYQHATTVH